MRATGALRQLRPEATIYREAERAAKIVRNLLVFTGSRRLVRRPVNLNAILQRVLASRQGTFRAQGIEIVRHYDDKLPRLKGDPLLLHQVFLNMVMNGAGVGHGRSSGAHRDHDCRAVRRYSRPVRDTGVDSSTRCRGYLSFYTTKKWVRGLGSWIAYGIVRNMVGRSRGESPRRWCCFHQNYQAGHGMIDETFLTTEEVDTQVNLHCLSSD